MLTVLQNLSLSRWLCLLSATPGLTDAGNSSSWCSTSVVSYHPTTLLQLTDPTPNINNCNIPQHRFRLTLEYDQRKMSTKNLIYFAEPPIKICAH